MSNARDKANIPALNFSSTGIDDNATSTAITISSAGRIGIGTTAPDAELQIAPISSGTNASIVLANSNRSQYFRIQNNETNDALVFNANDTNERLRIDSSGNVGIGTSSPSSYYANNLVVDIGSTAQSGITIVADSSNQAMLAFADGTSGDTRYRGYLDYNHSNDSLAFASAGTERMRIDSSGLVRITNTSSTGHGSTYNLIVGNESSGGDAGVLVVTPNNENAYYGFGDSGGVPCSLNYNHNSNFLRTYVNGSEAMRIDSSGNVGIGYSTFNGALNVDGNVGLGNFISASNPTGGTYNLTDPDGSTINQIVRIGEDDDGGNGVADLQLVAYGSNDNFGGGNLRFVNSRYSNDVALIKGSRETVYYGYLAFYTERSGLNERMRITSEGNVGIGTNSPSGSDFGSNTGLVHLKDIGANNTGIKLEQGAGKSFWYTNATNTFFGTTTAIPLRLYTNNTERMRIDSSGRVGISNTSPNYNLEIGESDGVSNRGLSFNLNNNVGQIRTRSNASDTQTHYEIINSNGTVGTIKTVGSATQFNTSSDYRLKENVSYDFDATTRLKELKPARFNFIADADTTVDGFLAHEVSSIVPEAISGEKDAMKTEEYEVTPAVLDEDGNVITEAVMGTREVPDYQGIDQSKLVPLLVKTIQELEARITALETNNP